MVEVIDGWLRINEDVNDLSSIDFSEHTKIYFGHVFDSPINSLPDHITHITFSGWSSYNKPINNLPNSIKYIKFALTYNQPTDLPNNIKIIKLCSPMFIRSIDKIPLTIKYIIFDDSFSLTINSNKIIFLNKFVKKIVILLSLISISIEKYWYSYYYLHYYILIDMYGARQFYYNRCEINKHNHAIRKTKLVDLLLK